MKKRLSLLVAIGLLLVISIYFSAFAQEPFPYCTDTPEYCQKKVAQVPIPWQFWGIQTDQFGNTTVIDRIRISPTWLNPPPGQPPGTAPIFIRRLVATSTAPIPLEGLVWDFKYNMPQPLDLEWELIDPEPIEVMVGQDVELEIPVTASDVAVLVAYEVFLDLYGLDRAVGHFINEAILESQSPQSIVEIRVNFDIHNDTGLDVTNFELDFQGLDFSCVDVLGAVGFIAAQGIPPVPVPPVIWGANPENPLVVRPIAGGTEVKWIQPDRPLHDCEWLHVGLAFDCTKFDCFNNPDDPLLQATVQGYWTVTEPCPGPTMPCFAVNKMMVLDKKKGTKRDKHKIKGTLKLPDGAAFDEATDDVTVTIGADDFTIPAGSFVYFGLLNLYTFVGDIPDVGKVVMIFNFDECFWRLFIRGKDASPLYESDGTIVKLTVGEYVSDEFPITWTKVKKRCWIPGVRLAKFKADPRVDCCDGQPLALPSPPTNFPIVEP